MNSKILKNKLLKLVVFPVGSLNVAFTIESVQKVIKSTQVYGSGLSHLGIAHIEDREITVIDLHKRLFSTSQPIPSEAKTYLILAKNSSGEQFGIIVNQTPSLVDVPLSSVRVLPESYRRADTLKIASHVTVVSQETEEKTIFILDTDQLIAQIV
ncbi:MAG: chemotaxis protein CheW [Gomphosphaeria aponina SAG 52.96 = DSM 107014]|uniref:Chemotaxis protein CheW n=1 Tax=Gomphosphaeria aponina SAG 52.96 = DSM 107014 TaxID=1521640 RepID=A0A941JNN8_9CHRO|nr:chemotaxis protein CheW [Gomphosphaeria aponina SAG 52.96 = DSM 107014]